MLSWDAKGAKALSGLVKGYQSSLPSMQMVPVSLPTGLVQYDQQRPKSKGMVCGVAGLAVAVIAIILYLALGGNDGEAR